MFSMDNQHPADIPRELHPLIHLNVAFRVLICPHKKCRKAVQPGAFSEHLRVKHRTSLRDRARVQQYVSTFRWNYDFSTIQLPRDGSRPQPVIPVIDGIQCRTCPFKSSNRKIMRVHGNREHKQQRMGDDELFTKVRVQSWFQDHRQRYWVVDESEKGDNHNTDESESEDDRDTTVEVGEEEERASSLGLRGDEGGVDASTHVEEDACEAISVVEARDEIKGVISGDTVIEAVVDDHEEVFSDFDDSEDADYKESSQGDVSDDKERGVASEVQVDESDDEGFTVVCDDRNTVDEDGVGIVIREGEESASRKGLRGNDGVIEDSTGAGDDEVEAMRVVEVRDDIARVVRDDTVIEVVDDDHAEVFSDFDDSQDADYEESSEGEVSDDNERGGSSEVEADESDDESFTVVGDDRKTVGYDKSTNGNGSHPGVEDDERSDRSGSIAPVDEEEDEIRVIWHRRVRKRKVPSTFEDRRGTGIDSEDDIFEPSSPVSSVPRGPERQRRMSEFVDSGVVMASSPDDGVVPPSSPPVRGWITPRRSEDVVERVFDTETIVERTGEDAGGDASSDDPSVPRHGHQYGGSDRSILDLLQDRLETWNRTCPACHLDRPGGKRHMIADCIRSSTTDIIKQATTMQRHMEQFGGFQGADGCSWCGVPRAICERWRITAIGDRETVPGQSCPYAGVLIPAVTTMMMDGSPEGWAVVGSWMDRAGVVRTSPTEVFEWFRQAVWWDDMGIDVARIVRVFHMLVNKNRGVGEV